MAEIRIHDLWVEYSLADADIPPAFRVVVPADEIRAAVPASRIHVEVPE